MNKILKQISLAGIAASALLFAGCGGGSASPVASTGLTRQVATSIQNGFFTKELGSQAQKSGRSPKRPLSPGDVTFDSFYELYAREKENGFDYFVDEALSKAAGSTSTVFTLEGSDFTQTETISITEGTRKGFRSTFRTAKNGLAVTWNYEGETLESGPFLLTGSYLDGKVISRSRNRDADGNDRFYDLTIEADGSSTVVYNSNQLFNYSLAYAADGSGSGTVQGTSALLPATLNWNTEGTGTLTFADGSTLAFSNFEFNSIP